MNFARELLREAFKALHAHKMRSFLTMLGIIIGVVAVITMISLGEGAKQAVQERLRSLGTNVLSVRAGQRRWHGVARSGGRSLTIDDANALETGRSGVLTEIVPQQSLQAQVELGGRNINVPVVGTTPNYFGVRNIQLDQGELFGLSDLAARRTVAVVGADVPIDLETTPELLLGQRIKIKGLGFTVAGVLASKGQQGWRNPDSEVIIPLSTMRHRVAGNDRLSGISVQIAGADQANLALVEIERRLREARRLRPGQPNDFRIRNQTDVVATFEETSNYFGFLLAGIAAVSLLVGGIGIMNIMLVSVTERTREIGVRKALGARRRDILFQFVAESLTLCLIGGIVGIGIGVGLSAGLAAWASWNTIVSPGAVLLAFGFSAAVGVFFGIYPARRASKLDPIEALRFE